MDLLRRSKVLRTSAVVAVFMLVLLTSAILIPIYNNIDITEAATGTAKESSLSFNLTNSTASVDLSVNNSNGTFATSTTPVSFNIYTTNYTGYTLSIKNSKSTTTLVNSTNSSYTLSSLTGTVTPTNFSADSTTAATNYNGKWGYLPSKLNSSTNTSYLPAPTTSATTLDKTSSANTSGTVNNYTIGIGARASYTTPAGEYTGTYILTAVGNPINYTVTYNKNTTDTVSSLPSNVDSSTSETNVSLSTTTPTREGYTFIGWCSVATTTNANGIDECSGTTYTTGDNYGIDQTTTNNATLYAMWEKNKVYMQGLSSDKCTTTASEAVDSRDGTTYTIQRLADGNCWLLENLRLNIADSTILNSMSSSNTNASDVTLGYLKGTATGAASDRWATSKAQIWTESSYASSSSYSDPLIQVFGVCQFENYCVNNPSSGSWISTADTSTANNGTDLYPGMVGIYYNYCAASAGSYCYLDNAGTGDASYDICPYGWRLPTGGSRNEFQALYVAYSSNYANFRNAFHFPLSGYFDNGVASNQGLSSGFSWSSTRNGTSRMYSLQVNYVNVNTSSNPTRNMGGHVRCILDQRVYMQDLTSASIAIVLPSVDSSTTAYDRRDGQEYSIAKLADGRYWMTKNLNLAGNTPLYASDSDVPTDYDFTPYFTLPASSTTGFSDNATAYVYNSNRTSCSASSACYSYYSWVAATAGGKDANGDTVMAMGYNAPYSICPRGWRLPTATTSNANALADSNWKTGDLYAFATAYGANLDGNYPSSDGTFYNNVNGGASAGKAPVYLLTAGRYSYSSFNNSSSAPYGAYWSSTSSGGGMVGGNTLQFSSSGVSIGSTSGFYGFPVRCVFGG